MNAVRCTSEDNSDEEFSSHSRHPLNLLPNHDKETSQPPKSSHECIGSIPSQSAKDPAKIDHVVTRVILRTLTYFIYDGFPVGSGQRGFARVAKVLVEFFVNEKYPPPCHAKMGLTRKCLEFLLAPATSSLLWFVVKRIQLRQNYRSSNSLSRGGLFVWLLGLWTVTYRICKQALIYRLFFRIGSLKYSAASALGIICCFFKESVFKDIVNLRRWPLHFSASQGLGAVFRSLAYAAAFSLPLQNVSRALKECARRRRTVKKLIFSLVLAQTKALSALYRHAWLPQRLIVTPIM